ncbi:hypothetical protein HDU76_012928 [Blyttiomyces sp. JEL0837]|nr:hypothetical protein HDU76_012928 [Blyttiomyces sp. JEL0837]
MATNPNSNIRTSQFTDDSYEHRENDFSDAGSPNPNSNFRNAGQLNVPPANMGGYRGRMNNDLSDSDIGDREDSIISAQQQHLQQQQQYQQYQPGPTTTGGMDSSDESHRETSEAAWEGDENAGNPPTTSLPPGMTSPTQSQSGLPSSYYDRYKRTYHLNASAAGSNNTTTGTGGGGDLSKGRALTVNSQYSEMSTSSSNGQPDHLAAAVDNLFKMVERKVTTALPPPVRTQDSPTHHQYQYNQDGTINSQYPPFSTSTSPKSAASTNKSLTQQNNQYRNLNRTNSWTTSAIHSEVSRLYHQGEAGISSSTTVPPEAAARPGNGNQSRFGNMTTWSRGIDFPGAATTATSGASDNGSVSRGINGGGRTRDTMTSDSKNAMASSSSMAAVNAHTMPLGQILFLYGFIFFPCWVVGACARDPSRWRTANRIASVVFPIVLVAVVVSLIKFWKQ